MKSNLKRTFLWLALSIFTFLFIAPLQAQVVRDHRTKKTDDKVRDHRTETNTTVRDHRTETNTTVRDHRENKTALTVPFFEEEGAFFGTRTEILEKYPSFKSTGKVNTIMITDKLHDGDNSIYKMKSGNTLHAIVKKGKIIKYTWKDSHGNQIPGGDGDDDLVGGSGRDSFVSRETSNSTCYKCTKICFHPEDSGLSHPDGGPNCWTTCVQVDCSEEHTHSIPGKVLPKPEE